jgi:hypothetical protein
VLYSTVGILFTKLIPNILIIIAGNFVLLLDGDQIERARSQHTAAACISIRYKNCASIIIIMQGDYVAKWNQSQLK